MNSIPSASSKVVRLAQELQSGIRDSALIPETITYLHGLARSRGPAGMAGRALCRARQGTEGTICVT